MPPGRPVSQPATLPPSQSTWWEGAACKGHRHPEWFTSQCHLPGPGRPGALTVNASRAVVVCSGCPVRAECLAEALLFTEQVGVWGGLTDAERRLVPHDRLRILRERYGSA